MSYQSVFNSSTIDSNTIDNVTIVLDSNDLLSVGQISDSYITSLSGNKISLGTVGTIYGGTGLNSYSTGDILYASAPNVLSKLSIGSASQIITSNGTIPTWSAIPSPTTISLSDGTAASPSLNFINSTTTGLFLSAADTLAISAAGVLRASVSSSALTSTVPFLAPDGSLTAPSYSFASDTNTGIISGGIDTIAFIAGGSQKGYIASTSMGLVIPIYATSGAATTPSYTFTFSPTTGLYLIAAGQLGFTTNGTLRLTLSTTALTLTLPLLTAAGSVTAPSHSFSADTNTGMYNISADNLGFATGGVLRLTIGTTAITPTLPIAAQLGAVATPSYTFTGDLNTGIYSSLADNLDFATGGVQRLNISTTNVQAFNRIIAIDGGAAATPSVVFDSSRNTGIYSPGIDAMNLCAAGADAINITTASVEAKKNLVIPTGTVTTPSLSFTADSNTGMYSSAADTIDFTTGGTSRVTVSTSAVTSTIDIATPTLTLNGSKTICVAMPNYILCVGQNLTTTMTAQTFELDYAGTSIFNGWRLPVGFKYTHITISSDSDATSASRTYNFEIYDVTAATIRSSGSLTTAFMGNSNTILLTLTVNSSLPADSKTQLRVSVSAAQAAAAEFIVYMHGYPG